VTEIRFRSLRGRCEDDSCVGFPENLARTRQRLRGINRDHGATGFENAKNRYNHPHALLEDEGDWLATANSPAQELTGHDARETIELRVGELPIPTVHGSCMGSFPGGSQKEAVERLSFLKEFDWSKMSDSPLICLAGGYRSLEQCRIRGAYSTMDFQQGRP
jgi:hypothetical protein